MALVLHGYIENNYDRPTGAVPDSCESFGYTRIGPDAGVGLPVRRGGAGRRPRPAPHPLRLPRLRGRRRRARCSGCPGVRTDRVVIAAHVLCSAVRRAHRAVPRQPARLGHAAVGTDGGYDLESIAAVVLGGTALAGGRGGWPAPSARVLVLAVLDNIFNQLERRPVPQAGRCAAWSSSPPWRSTPCAPGRGGAIGTSTHRPTARASRHRTRDRRRGTVVLARAGARRHGAPIFVVLRGAARVDRHREPELHRAARCSWPSSSGRAAGRAGRRAVLRDRRAASSTCRSARWSPSRWSSPPRSWPTAPVQHAGR